MLLTAPLLAKTSFFGSLVNKCRPAAIAGLSNNVTIRDASTRTTLEEKVGLPPPPRKPMTPFFRFLREQRPKVAVECPKLRVPELIRLLAKRWNEKDDAFKRRLQEEFKRDQRIYVETRAKYEAKITDNQRADLKILKQELQDLKERRLMRKRVQMLGRPKKPASAFLLFIVAERKATPQAAQMTYREWHKNCTEKWKRLSDKEKEGYIADARQAMATYKKDIAEWEEKMVRMGNVDVVRHAILIDPPEPKSRSVEPTT